MDYIEATTTIVLKMIDQGLMVSRNFPEEQNCQDMICTAYKQIYATVVTAAKQQY